MRKLPLALRAALLGAAIGPVLLGAGDVGATPVGPGHGMKRWRAPEERPIPAVTPVCSGPPKPSYFDGPIVQTPVIVPVFWSSNVNAEVQANLPQFFADVTHSTYWAWLWEYDSLGITGGTGQVIVPGSANAGVTLKPSKCAGTTSCALADTDIRNELSAQIAAGTLPAPTLDCTGNVQTIYMIEFPPNVTITGPTGYGQSCTAGGFCAYHSTGTYGTAKTPLLYGVLMDQYSGPCATGCGANVAAGGHTAQLNDTTDTASRALAGAVTDPDIGLDTQLAYAKPAGWADNNCGEIGDICAQNAAGDPITVSGRTWYVQELWSKAQNKCTSTGPAKTCSSGDDCGTQPYGCVTLSCGTCTAPQTCGGGGVANQCGCTPAKSCPAGDDCGAVSDGCGGMISCGTCGSNQVCTMNKCASGSTSTTTTTGAGGSASSGTGSTGSGGGNGGSGGAASSSGSSSSGSSSSGSSSSGSSSSGSSSSGTTSSGETGTGGGASGGPNRSGGCGCKTAGDPDMPPNASLSALGALVLAGMTRRKRVRSR